MLPDYKWMALLCAILKSPGTWSSVNPSSGSTCPFHLFVVGEKHRCCHLSSMGAMGSISGSPLDPAAHWQRQLPGTYVSKAYSETFDQVCPHTLLCQHLSIKPLKRHFITYLPHCLHGKRCRKYKSALTWSSEVLHMFSLIFGSGKAGYGSECQNMLEVIFED